MEQKRVLSLIENADFQTARLWDVFARFAVSRGGKDVTILAGTWLLDMGLHDFGGGYAYYEYRLANGDVITRQTPLPESSYHQIEDPQVLTAMNAFRDVDTALEQDFGIGLDRLCRGLPPFALIKCPLCGGTKFTTCDLASAWCDTCNASFSARPTCGDPGFCVDVHWEHYSMGSAIYLVPPTDTLLATLTLKDSNDPRDMNVTGCDCKEGEVKLTDNSIGLRPGLHDCKIGTLYDWRKLYGTVPRPEDIRESAASWNVDGEQWPQCATVRVLSLGHGERSYIESAQHFLGAEYKNLKDGLAALAAVRSTRLSVFDAALPPAEELGEGERYMLHHWIVVTKHSISSGDYELGMPVWYVVRMVVEDRYIRGWNVVRKDICPCCGKRILPEQMDAKQYTCRWDDPHRECRETWTQMPWLTEETKSA